MVIYVLDVLDSNQPIYRNSIYLNLLPNVLTITKHVTYNKYIPFEIRGTHHQCKLVYIFFACIHFLDFEIAMSKRAFVTILISLDFYCCRQLLISQIMDCNHFFPIYFGKAIVKYFMNFSSFSFF